MCLYTPKVSIIVPVHNAATTLGACVQSIMEQTYENTECILIENGSMDESKEICREYSKLHKDILFAISQRTGASEARNLGLSMATGDIIGFCDADDIMEQDALKMVVSEFIRNPDIIGVIGAFYVGHITTNGIQKRYRGLKSRKISSREAMVLTIGNDNVMGSVWNKYYRVDALREIWFDPELAYCEDMHFNAKVLSAALINEKIMLIDYPLYCYIQNDQSVTHQTNNLFEQNGNLKYILALKRILSDCNPNRLCQSIVKMRIASLAIGYLVSLQLNKKQQMILTNELKENYCYLLRNVTRFHCLRNLRKVYQGAKILVKDKMLNFFVH